MTYEKLLDMVDVKEVDGVLYGELKITLEGSMPYFTDDGIRVPWEIASKPSCDGERYRAAVFD